MNLKIEFTQTMYPKLFSNSDDIQQHVDVLNRITRSHPGDAGLALWDYISIGYDHATDNILGVVYSPRALGRDFSDTPEDIQEAYFCVFDNYVFGTDALTLERLEEDFGEEHDNYCSQPLSDLFDAWMARNQKRTLEQNIEQNIEQTSILSKRKI